MPRKAKSGNNKGSELGFEEKLWAAADKLRSHMDAAEYKHVVLGLIFLKYISDRFQDRYDELVAEAAEGADAEDRDEYTAENVFWVPPQARWGYLQKNAKTPEIGRYIDDAEGEIRQAMLECDLVDCMVALPGQLFYTTQIPVCLWFLARDRANGLSGDATLRDRLGEVLFIDARKLGTMIDRAHKELTEEDIAKIADTYHAWRTVGGVYEDVPGFCKSASLEEVRKHGHVLTPGRYVGAEEAEDDGEPFEEKFDRLKAQLEEQLEEGRELEAEIRTALERLSRAG